MKKAKSQALASNTLAYALHEVALLLNRSLDLEEILDSLPLLIKRIVPYDFASIILVENDEAVQARYYGNKKILLDGTGARSYKIQEIPSLQLMNETHDPLLIPDTEKSSIWITKPHVAWVNPILARPSCQTVRSSDS